MSDAFVAELEFDVQALRVVKAIADEGSITAAAAALGYSQPAISQQLKRLERSLGVALVERVGRTVRLTEAGRILARHAPAVTTALDAAAGELAELRGLRSGRVRLVGFPSASPTVVPRLLAELAAQHPGVSVTYIEAEPPEAVQAVREDRADIALTFSYPGDRDDPHGPSARGLSVRDGRQRRPARGAPGRAPGRRRRRRRRVGAVGGAVDRGLPPLPWAPARAVRAGRLRAAHRVRDRQLRRRRGTRRAGDRRGDAAAHGRGVLPAAARGRSRCRCRLPRRGPSTSSPRTAPSACPRSAPRSTAIARLLALRAASRTAPAASRT